MEIYYDDDDVWGNICDDSYFGYNEANNLHSLVLLVTEIQEISLC